MIKVGITEMHGIAQEYAASPPHDVEYRELKPEKHISSHLISSSAKGVFAYFSGEGVDLVEAPLFPVITPKPWIYTPADYPTCANFGLAGMPLPRSFRLKFLEHVFLRKNFKKLLFKSQAGQRSISDYGKVKNPRLLEKVGIVYPAVRRVNDDMIRFNKSQINITFVGDFLSKGGTHVVDVFEILQKTHGNLKLRVCAGEKFKTNNKTLAEKYLKKMNENRDITFGFVKREVLLSDILPETDIFISPTYRESYGYAIEEACAYGIPVISTRHAAIPEIVEHEKSGFLVEIENFEFIREFRDYTIDAIPDGFNRHMNEYIHKYLKILIDSYELRVKMGMAALKTAREKFSFETRNKIMGQIYEDALYEGK